MLNTATDYPNGEERMNEQLMLTGLKMAQDENNARMKRLEIVVYIVLTAMLFIGIIFIVWALPVFRLLVNRLLSGN